MRASAGRAAPPARRRRHRAPIIEHPDVQRMLLTMQALTRRRARDLLRHRGRDRPRASRHRRGARARPRTSAPRCSRRSPRRSRPTSASRSPRSACRCMAAWASSRRPARRSIYRDARIAPIYEGTNGIQAIDLVDAQAAARRAARRCEAYLDELRAHRRSGQRPPTIRPSARPARGSPRRSTASTARPTWLLGAARERADSRARRRDALSAAVRDRGRRRCWPRRRWRRCGSPTPKRRRASRSRASSPRTSRCRRRAERAVIEGADSVNEGARRRWLE